MGAPAPKLILLAVTFGLLACFSKAQDAVIRPAPAVSMPVGIDSNSPAFWRDGRLFWYSSHGGPRLSEGPSQFGPWVTRSVDFAAINRWPCWMESVYPEDNGVLWGWYHTEPSDLIPDSTLTAPKIGAVISLDGGATLRDLGIILESGDPINPVAQNGYFAGGHGDFTVILDRTRTYFYFFFDNYGGGVETQGVCVARMAYEDRANPDGKVWKYHNGSWQEAGRGGRVTPIFPVRKAWESRDPDALWGPSVHWNTHLNCWVMLLNRASGEPGWAQEGVYVSFSSDLSRPNSWTTPRKILDKSEFNGWYFFYPQVMGLEAGGTDRLAGQVARLYVGGISKWEIEFVAPPSAPTAVQLQASGVAAVYKIGETVTLTVTAGGTGPLSYQWLKDGVALPQATGRTYTIAAAVTTDGGVYTVVVSNALGVVTSNPVQVTVSEPAPPVPPAPEVPAGAFLSNLSIRTQLTSNRSGLTIGFVQQGSTSGMLAVRAIGPSLAAFGLAGATPDPRLEVFDATGASLGENDDWQPQDAEAFAAFGAFSLAAGSADAALVFNAPPDAGTVRVSGTAGALVLLEIYDPTPTAESKLVNLSARGRVGRGDKMMIGGFGVTGAGAKRLLIRALGPRLLGLGVTEAVADPVLEVYTADGTKLAENAGWPAELEVLFAATGALSLPSGSRDAAVEVTVEAGSGYTILVRSASNVPGEALLEIYELP